LNYEKDTEFGYKTRQILNEGTGSPRQQGCPAPSRSAPGALANQAIGGYPAPCCIGHGLDFNFGVHARTMLAILALA
jgi:hypothetical protein